MKLTIEQQASIARQRGEGRRSLVVEATTEQQGEYREVVARELAGKGANIEHSRKRRIASQEPGFSGDLRRAINATRKPAQDLAQELGLDPELIDQFCAGDVVLSSNDIDSLVEHLGLRLMKTLS